MMKTNILLLSLLLLISLPAIGQSVMFVTAENGLIVREGPDRQAKRIGKLPYAARVQVQQKPGIRLSIQDDGQTIDGEWVKVRQINDEAASLSGYVFNGFLTTQPLYPRMEVKFQDMSFSMDSFEIYDPNHELDKNHHDKAIITVGLGELPTGKYVTIDKGAYQKVEVFQRYENSLTIMDEGPHCDLREWKHYDSDWEKLTFDNKKGAFLTHSYSRKTKVNLCRWRWRNSKKL